MVQSRLKPEVIYKENKNLDPDDKNMDADLYEIYVKNKRVVIALGQPKYNEADIVFFPVYLIKDEKVSLQIGVYEILSEQQTTIYDEDDDIDVEKLGEILLYTFVTNDVLKEHAEEEAEAEEAEVEEAEAEEAEVEEIIEQTEYIADMERKAYKKTKGEPWIQTFMKNKNFSFMDNEGGGDCLFASIRDGLSTIGRKVSVDEMRNILANEADQSLFDTYFNLYEQSVQEMNNIKQNIIDLVKQHKDLKARAKKSKDIEEQKKIVEDAKKVASQHATAKKNYALAQSLSTEFAFMSDVKSLDQFRDKLRSCEFWGETWEISTLERVLNIKLILFSLQAYNSKDYDNVLLCGQLNDDILQSIGAFEPDHYIMLEYMGAHYRLIKYKERGAFKFKEIPYDVRKLVVNKCLEGQSGPFHIIPEFKQYLKEKQIILPEIESDVDILQDLYDDRTVFQFYSKSADSKPGKGSGEKIGPEGVLAYSDLASIPEWRKKLSNFWIAPFTLEGHTWNSVEHYYQASKFKENNPEFYKRFALDVHPEEPIAQDPAIAKAAGGKSGKFKGKQIRPKDVIIDPDFFGGRHIEEMEKAMTAKFSQNPELKQLLLATRKAKLVHFQRGSPPVLFEHLMRVRQELSKQN